MATRDDTRLLPCPHCGGKASLFNRPAMPMGEGNDWGARCENSVVCGAEISAYGHFTPDSAVTAWNRRVAATQCDDGNRHHEAKAAQMGVGSPPRSQAMDSADLTRPIVGIENRTAREVFDIMSDRIKNSTSRSQPAGVRVKVTDQMIYAAMMKADDLDFHLDDIDAREIITAALSALEPQEDGAVALRGKEPTDAFVKRGQTYASREGARTTIIGYDYDGGPLCFQGDNGSWYSPSGAAREDAREDARDLVAVSKPWDTHPAPTEPSREGDIPSIVATDVCALETLLDWSDGRSTDEQWSGLHGAIQEIVAAALATPSKPVSVTDEMVDVAHAVIEQSFRSEPWEFGPPSLLARKALRAALEVSP